MGCNFLSLLGNYRGVKGRWVSAADASEAFRGVTGVELCVWCLPIEAFLEARVGARPIRNLTSGRRLQ